MKKWVVLSVMGALAFGFFMVPANAQNEVVEGWIPLKSEHFIVYYRGRDQKFPSLVLSQAEFYYDAIAVALGYSRRDNFWLWEKRCLIYLYPSKTEFHHETRQAEWSGGYAVADKRTIVSYLGDSQFLDSILPHELAHLVFRDFVGAHKPGIIPLWLDEGVAMSQEKAKREYFDRLVAQMISKKTWAPLKTLSQIRSLNGMDTHQSAIFYAESQSLVRFLLGFGPTRFVQFCRDLRDGKTLEDAFRANYPNDFPSIQACEDHWVHAHA